MKASKRMNWEKLAIIILAITLTSVTIFALNKETKDIAEKAPNEVYVGYEAKEPLDNFSREEAVKSLTKIMVDVEEDIEGKDRSINDRLKLLDDGEKDMEDILSKEVVDAVYFAEEFGKDKFNRQFATSSLLVFNQIIKDGTQSENISPVIDKYDDIVYLDSKLMTAHIPLDIYIGNSTGIAFEMQYIDGNWKLNPYTSMMSLNLMGILGEKAEQDKSSKDS